MDRIPDTVMNGTETTERAEAADTTTALPAEDLSEKATDKEQTSAQTSKDPLAGLTTYTKRLLPESLSSPYPHGLITGEPRTPAQQEAFEARKAEILRTMSDQQIEERYQDTAKKVEEALKEIEEGNERVAKEIEAANKTRETERKVWASLKKAGAEG